MRHCKSCGLSKALSGFTKQKRPTGKFSYMNVCKECKCAEAKVRYQTYTTEQKAANKSRTLVRLYGIDLKEYNKLFEQQDGKCPCCDRHQSELAKSLVVDHCHSSKKIRGLLCSGCNLALGNVRESIETLHRLSKYLERQ